MVPLIAYVHGNRERGFPRLIASAPFHFATLSFTSASLQHFALFSPYVFSLKYEPHNTTV